MEVNILRLILIENMTSSFDEKITQIEFNIGIIYRF